jgi:hypothetical protein
MIVLFPSMLGQSIEGSLAPKYEFLVNEMQRSIDEVIDFPQVRTNQFISVCVYIYIYIYIYIFISICIFHFFLPDF